MAHDTFSTLLIAIALAEENAVYQDMVIKFLEQFVMITRALDRQGLFDSEEAFFYDRITPPGGEPTPVRVNTIAGLIPLLPAVALPMLTSEPAQQLGKRFARLRERFLRDWEDRSSAASARSTSSARCSSRCSHPTDL